MPIYHTHASSDDDSDNIRRNHSWIVFLIQLLLNTINGIYKLFLNMILLNAYLIFRTLYVWYYICCLFQIIYFISSKFSWGRSYLLLQHAGSLKNARYMPGIFILVGHLLNIYYLWAIHFVRFKVRFEGITKSFICSISKNCQKLSRPQRFMTRIHNINIV